MNRVERIENAIIADSNGWFDHVRVDLHVTIRIANDFYDFLVKFGESPDAYEIVYMMGTIVSGIDEFYQLALTSRSMGLSTPLLQLDFLTLREQFMQRFERIDDAGMSLIERMNSLFALTHLQLLFLAQNFPSAIFAKGASDLGSAEQVNSEFSELMSELREMQPGRLTVEEAAARAEARRKRRKA